MGASVFFAGSSELAALTNTFTVDGVNVDPTEVTVTVLSPSGVTTVYDSTSNQIDNTSVGVWTLDVDCSSEPGEWQYDWVGTGIAQDHQTGTWLVQETAMGHLYAGIDALKSRIGINDSVDDFELHSACFAASRSVEAMCGRMFWRTLSTEVRTFTPAPWPKGMWHLEMPTFSDLVNITTLKTDEAGDGTFETTWSASDYQLLPVNPQAAPETRPYTSIRAVRNVVFPLIWQNLARDDRVQITGTYGWPAVPYAIRQATLLAAAQLFKMKDAPFGVTGFGDLGIIRVQAMPMVAQLVGPYMRRPVLVA